MGRIFTVTTPNGEHDIDLGTITDIWAPTRSAKWVVGRGPESADIALDADTGAAVRAAWRAYHEPRPAKPWWVAEYQGAPPLPQGWEIVTNAGPDTEARHTPSGKWCAVRGSFAEVVSTCGYVPFGVIDAAVSAHRARSGGAS